MYTRVAQEITQLLADEHECPPSATRRLAKARLVASIAEGLRLAAPANMGAGLGEGLRAAFLDARLSLEKWHLVVSALSRDPGDQAEVSSAAALLDGVDAEPSPPPRDVLAQAVTMLVKSAAKQAPAISGRRAWWRPAVLPLATSLAALILLMAVVPGLLSLAGTESPAPVAEQTGSVRPAAQSATTGSEPILLPPEPIERARSILVRGETSSVSCDEVVGHDHGTSEIDMAEALCESRAAIADTHSTKPQPRSDGASLRTTTSRQSNDFRLGMVADSLYAIPDGLYDAAHRAVSFIDKLGKKTLEVVDPRCIVGQLQMDASKSRGNKSLPRRCANHITFPVAQSRVENKERVQ